LLGFRLRLTVKIPECLSMKLSGASATSRLARISRSRAWSLTGMDLAARMGTPASAWTASAIMSSGVSLVDSNRHR
jgi:hypothetical protein